jgi:hypothetical protein
MKDKKRILVLDHIEHGIIVRALNDMRNKLIEDGKFPDLIDDILLKAIDAPIKKFGRRITNAKEN